MIWPIGAFVLNLVLGVSLVLGVFRFMEQRVMLGATGGIGAGTTIIYAQATLGEQMLTVTVSEMKLLDRCSTWGCNWRSRNSPLRQT